MLGDLRPATHPGLRHLAVPIADVLLDPPNVNTHPPEQLEVLKSMLREFGQRLQLVTRASTGILEAGEWTARIPGPGDPLELRFTVAADAPPVVLPAPLPRVDAPPPPLPTVTGSLTIHLGPPRALRGTVEISLKNDAGLRKETQKTAEATWELPRGTWTVSASAPDLTATSQTVTVGDLPRRLDLSLRLTPAARRSRIVVPAILGAAAATGTIAISDATTIGLAIAMREGGDVLALGRNIDAALARIRAGLPLAAAKRIGKVETLFGEVERLADLGEHLEGLVYVA